RPAKQARAKPGRDLRLSGPRAPCKQEAVRQAALVLHGGETFADRPKPRYLRPVEQGTHGRRSRDVRFLRGIRHGQRGPVSIAASSNAATLAATSLSERVASTTRTRSGSRAAM